MSKPIGEVRDGWLSGTIWGNEGSNGTYFTVTFKRGYKDKESGEIKDTSSMNADDLLKLANLATEAHNKIRAYRAELNKPSE